MADDPHLFYPRVLVSCIEQSVKEIMEGRVMKAAGKGCDAIEPDNMAVSQQGPTRWGGIWPY